MKIILSLFVLYFFKGLSYTNNKSFDPLNSISNRAQESDNKYLELRNLSLSATPKKLQLFLDNRKTIVYGIVMDWDIDGGVATIVAYQTGDVSMYLSSGQIYIGGITHPTIKKAGLDFVYEAKHYLSKATKTINTPLPDKNCVRFYLLSNHGKFTHQDSADQLENKSSAWSKLFALGNIIVTENKKIVFDK